VKRRFYRKRQTRVNTFLFFYDCFYCASYSRLWVSSLTPGRRFKPDILGYVLMDVHWQHRSYNSP
jgi:hypothetical protein